MAMQRIIVAKSIDDLSNTLISHTVLKASQGLPDVSVPPYLIDFGYVINNTEVHYTVLIQNYGPVNVEPHIKIQNRKKANELGFKFQYKKGCLSVGGITPLTISFHPSKEKFKEMEHKVNQSFLFVVSALKKKKKKVVIQYPKRIYLISVRPRP